MKKLRFEILPRVLPVLFAFGVALSLLGRQLCKPNIEDFTQLQPEYRRPDVINSLLADPESGQFYVCYNDGESVNAYSAAGEFLWSVATPYIRNSEFTLRNGMLFIHGNGDAYQYNASDGAFLGFGAEDELGLAHSPRQTDPIVLEDGTLRCGTYQVYKDLPDGTTLTLVERPWWHWIFHFTVGWIIGFSAGLALGALKFWDLWDRYHTARQDFQFTSKRTKFVTVYFQCTTAVQLLYLLVSILGILVFHQSWLLALVIPIGWHFIAFFLLSGALLYRVSKTSNEYTVLQFWQGCAGASLIAGLITAIACVVIAG